MAHTLHHPLAAPSRLDIVIAQVRGALGRRRACLATLHELDALTDRDLGFLRCDLRRIACETMEAKR